MIARNLTMALAATGLFAWCVSHFRRSARDRRTLAPLPSEPPRAQRMSTRPPPALADHWFGKATSTISPFEWGEPVWQRGRE